MTEEDLLNAQVREKFDGSLLSAMPGNFVYVPRYHILHARLIVDESTKLISCDKPTTEEPDVIIHNQFVTVIATIFSGRCRFIFVMTMYAEFGWIVLINGRCK